VTAEQEGNTKKAGRLERSIQRNEAQLVAIKDNFSQVQSEIATMAGSNQEYHIVEESGLKSTVTIPGGTVTNEKGITSFNFNTGAVDITIDPNASTGIFAHELKHGYQFETGTMSLGARGKTYFTSFLYDQTDENEAYQRQNLFGKTQTNKYDYLPPGPIDINSVRWYGVPISNLNQYEYQTMLKRLKGNIAFRKEGKTYY
jgi:hypothetical protein